MKKKILLGTLMPIASLGIAVAAVNYYDNAYNAEAKIIVKVSGEVYFTSHFVVEKNTTVLDAVMQANPTPYANLYRVGYYVGTGVIEEISTDHVIEENISLRVYKL